MSKQDRVAEIRERLQTAQSHAAPSLHIPRADLEFLLSEDAQMRAQLAAIWKLREEWGGRSPDEPCFELWDRLDAALVAGGAS